MSAERPVECTRPAGEPMIKQPCGPICALVITLLMIPTVALALMSDRVLAAEPQIPDLKPLFDLLDMLDRSWLGAASKSYGNDGNRWTGVWPKGGTVWPKNETKSETKSEMVIYSEPGGVIKEHLERWRELARFGMSRF